MSTTISPRNIRTPAAAALLLMAACAANGLPPPRDEFRGTYSTGFEVSSFEPCSSGEQWWVLPSEDLHVAYERTVGEGAKYAYAPVFARLRGGIGPAGRYGYLGVYQHELTVTEVLAIREPRQGDCG